MKSSILTPKSTAVLSSSGSSQIIIDNKLNFLEIVQTLFSKNFEFIPSPLPSRYRFGPSVTDRYRHFILIYKKHNGFQKKKFI